jgi:AcrR family transcriptional regulator
VTKQDPDQVAKQDFGPETRDKDARMRALVNAATELFAEEGYAPVSTRRIADLAGCSETLLFRYFGGKRGLLRAISVGLVERGSEATIPEFNDVHECVRGYLLHVFETMRQRSATLKVVIAALVTEPSLAQDFESLHDDAVSRLAKQFRRFQAAGDIAADVDVDAIAIGLEQMGFSLGFMMQIIFRRPQSELEAIADIFATVMTSGLQPDAVGTPISGSLRQQTVQRAIEASQGLEKIITLLESWPTPTDGTDDGENADKGLNEEAKRKPRRTATRRNAAASSRQG